MPGNKSGYISILACLIVSAMFICMAPDAAYGESAKHDADKATAASNKDGEGDKSYTKLDQIVVTATETAKTVAELPQSVTVVNQGMIEKTGSAYITDTFQYAPGVAIHDYNASGFGNQLHVRGYDYDRIYNSLDFQLEGVSVHSNAAWNNHLLNSIPKLAVDKIEFLKGMGTSMYGSRATIGVVNTFLKRDFGPPNGKVSLSYGSFNQFHGSAAASCAYQDASFNLAVDYGQGDSYHDYQSFDRKSVALAPTILLGDNTTVDLTVLYSKHELTDPMYSFISQAQVEANREQNFDRGTLESDSTFLGGAITHDFTNTISWVTKAGYYRENEDMDMSGDGSGNSYYEYLYHAHFPTDSYDLRSYLSVSDIGTIGSIFTAGIHYHYDESESYADIAGAAYNNAEAQVSNYAAFAQYEWKVWEPLTISFGVRGDFYVSSIDDYISPSMSYSDKEEWAVSPRIGANWEVIKNINLYATFGTGFRVPTPYELAEDSSLEPEESLNYEVGVKARLFEFWETVLSLYRNDYENMICYYGAYYADSNTTETIYSNSGKAIFQGIDWANYFNFGGGFSGYFHVLLDDSHYDDWKSGENSSEPYDYSGAKTTGCPHTQIKVGGNYAANGWDIGVDAAYYDDYYSDESDDYIMDEYINVDAHISYSYNLAKLTLFVNNIFDEEYYASAWKGMQFPAPGRNFMLTLELDF